MLGRQSDQRGLWEADSLYLDHVGRGSFYGLLALMRGKLFRDEDFAELYCADNGRDSVPPSLLATALLLQTYDRASDAEAKQRADFDIRWKVALGIGKRLSGLLREAMELRQSYRRGEASDYVAETERLRREVSYHLRDRPMPDRDNVRLQNELGWHDDRGNLLRFLDDPGIEPTNNWAERALRGAVIARKVSHCSKNEDGADAFSAFTSVIRTLARNGDDQSLVDGLCAVFSGAPGHTRSS